MDAVFRMLFALGVVLGLMWLMARFARKQYGAKPDAVLSVLARQPLGRTSSVAVVKVLDKALIIGVTEQGINLLSDIDLEQIEAALALTEKPAIRAPRALRSALAGDPDVDIAPDAIGSALPIRKGALNGSALSPATWKQLVSVAREATVRK